MAQRVFTERYQIVRHLARGGMAEVYLAHDLLLDRPVALKVLFPEFSNDRSFVERFRREARAAANLNHPNIVSIYDWGEEGGTYFIVMEYVDGRTLRDVIRTEGPLHPTRAAEIGADIAAALHFAHAPPPSVPSRPHDPESPSSRPSVIHRDVKPGNVMIAGLVKVTDFGIARAGDPSESLTQTGAVMGTATYFSPEQAQGHQIDPRSDVYSLGVVLYEMVTGRPPFTGDSPVAIAYQHVREEPVPPSRINTDVPPAFEAIVLTAMAKRREDRYRSAAALRADLLRFAQGQPVAAMAAGVVGGSGPGTGPPGPPPNAAPTGVMAPVGAGAAGGAATTAMGGDGTRVMSRGTEVVVDEYEERVPPRTSTYIVILAVLLAVLAGMLFLLARTLGVGGGSEVVVPGVVGDSQEVATQKLRDVGLKADPKSEPNDANEPGKVLAQDPASGARLKKGSSVKIAVSGGAAQIEVPDVIGKKVADARDELEDKGFAVQTTQRADEKAAQGQVLDQTPKGSEKAAKGSVVRLVVSSGPEEVPVPSLFNVPEAEAAAELRDKGFVPERTTTTDSSVAAGRVVRTDPGAGTPLAKGSTVTMIVSTGAPATTAPPTTQPPATTTPTTTPATTAPSTTRPPSTSTPPTT